MAIDVSQTSVLKNEVGYVIRGEQRIKAEVLRVQGAVADMQVFEAPRATVTAESRPQSGLRPPAPDPEGASPQEALLRR